MSYILFAVFAQNMLLHKAIGMSDIITAISHRRSLPKLLLLVGCWSGVGIMMLREIYMPFKSVEKSPFYVIRRIKMAWKTEGDDKKSINRLKKHHR